MATTLKRQVGTMGCMCCGHTIPVKTAENGTLNAACAWCDFPAYAKAGTEAHRIITSKLQNQQPATVQPPAKPVRTAAAPAAPAATAAPETNKPAATVRRSIFDLGTA